MTNQDSKVDPREAFARHRHEFGEHGGVNMSIEASTTFTVLEPGTMPEIFAGLRGPDEGGCYLYGRHFNPTVYALGAELAAIEGTDAAYCTSSGMAAIAATVLQLCDHGDHVVAGNTIYGGSFALLRDFLPRKAGIEATFVDVTDHDAIAAAFTKRTRALYVETMSNPTLAVADIPRLAAMARSHGAALVVDNTFCPVVISPSRLGADVVVHSLTKFISGASDIIAGAICGTHEYITGLMDLHLGSLMLLGPTMDPRVAFHLSTRLPHLGIRMAEHGRRAEAFARRLDQLGLDVTYPGLPSHPQYELLKRLANPGYGFGGILALDLGTRARAEQLMDVLQNEMSFGYMAVSLGYHDTLMSCSASSTSSELPDEALVEAGISPGLVRMSIGYTGSLEQRWEQLHEALRKMGLVPK
jgi:methionine-gamma-lyase